MSAQKTAANAAVVRLDVKDPDAFGDLIEALGLSEDERNRYFEWSECADLEIEVARIDGELRIIGGRILERKAAQ